MADGQVVFEITADGKQAIANIKDITKAIEKETKKWDDAAEGSAKDAESSWDKAVKGIVGKLTAAGVAAIFAKWGKAAIEAASDLEEVQNVVDVTFGEGSSKIESWAKNAGKQFGLTETQAKKFTSTLGAMAKSAGVNSDEIVEMSTDLAGLAADMASFYNLDFETAFQKIRSGISGETEPLKQLGVNMSVANLEAFALEKGITKSFNAMSQGEQTMLRYQYLMQATADAQGDFSRTADGFANATRRVETAMDTIKTKAGQLVLPVIADMTEALAGFLEKLTADTGGTVLDDFADIDKDIATKTAILDATYDTAQKILGTIKDISKDTTTLSDGSTTTFGELFESISKIDSSGGDIGDYIKSLGLDVDEVTSKYQEWKEAVKQLTSTVPALTSVINSETGAIEGGTDALDENLKAWKENEEKKLAYSAYYSKARALEEKKASMYLYQFDADAAAQAAKSYREYLQKTYGATFDETGAISANTKFEHSSDWEGSQWIEDAAKYNQLLKEEVRTKGELESQTTDYSKAEQQLADGLSVLEEKYGKVEEAAVSASEATEVWTDDQKNAGQAVIENIKALADYVLAVHDATEAAVNGVVKGFDKIIRPTTELEEKRSKLIEQQNALNLATDEGKRKYDEYQKQIDELNKSINEYNPQGMLDGLKSQLAFMDEYMDNLEAARKMGLSDDLLSFLSDGSVQSAEYLAQLVANPQQAAQIDAMYQQVQEKKKGFTDALTEQKLAADETYRGMVETAENAIEDMNLGEEAEAAMGDTVAGLAKGISDKVPDVKQAVNSLLSELNRLNEFGINFSIGSFGSLGTYAGNSAPTMNYDGLGSVIGGNSGGNVYLDGRQVGSVISKQQGNSMRALQRSGWQAP